MSQLRETTTSLFLLGWCLMACAQAMADGEITQLKDLYLDTDLVTDGRPQAVIAAPPGDRYQAAVDVLQDAVQTRSGTRLPLLRDAGQTAGAEELLATQNVIALGNMATNPFIEKLYLQWYSQLDLKYPGKGGHVLRSLHNPYATGHNVILLGGSDDAGVSQAADTFCAELDAGDLLQVGWLMKVELGDGIIPPDLITEDGDHVGVLGQSGLGGGQMLLGPTCEDDAGSQLKEDLRCALSDCTRAAGDQCDLALE